MEKFELILFFQNFESQIFVTKKSWNFAMLIPIRIFGNLLLQKSVIQNSEKLK
jgi:hypothetical protein